ncbi:leucine-rich repeat serine/threonine-protein kinase 1 [Centruroides vittatus]|uniref:leucine-rich repeat serine/threonine-protein kinase 1 n=1 Tax=Centruroides vittatus TaxID=120091 RepID=UPI0035105635
MAEDDNEEEFSGLLLHQAALWGNAELLEDLLHGEQLQYLNAMDSLGRTALHAAATNANETCTRILLQAGADPNIAAGPKGHNKTPLHVAAENGHLSTVELLTEFQANLLAKDINGLTALDLAEKSDHPQVMEALRKAADEQEQKRQELYLALWDSCSKGEVSHTKQIIRELGREAELVINSAPNGCSTLLFKACEEGQKDMVKFLLDKGADGRIHPVTKYSPLYIACYYGRKDIVEIILKKFPELVRVPTVEKWLPIHAAAINGHVHVLDLLLNFSYPSSIMQSYIDKTGNWEYYFPFDINAKDVTGQTVLYVGCYVGNQRLVDTLLKFKIKAQRRNHSKENFDEKNEQKENLEISSRKSLSDGLHNVMVKLKLKSNSNLQESRTESEIRPIDLDAYCNNNTETCLHVAVRNKHYNIVSMLLQYGANPNLCVKQPDDYSTKTQEDYIFPGSSPLMEACKNHDGTMVDSLIRYGARDDDCKALKIACSYNDEHIVSRLLSLKAYQDPEFKINKKALEISPSTQLSGFMNSVTYSSMFPTTPVMINWHGQKCLNHIQEQWLINACVTHNIKLKLTPRNQTTALIAITRLDISNNQLTELPLCIFQMPSLKILNAAQNKIFKLPESVDFSHSNSLIKSKHSTFQLPSQWHCPVLEEIHLQENRLDNVPPCLFDLPSLILLDLSNNKLQSLPFKMWSAPKLRELNLSLNMLHDLPYRSGPNLLDPRQICNIAEDQTTSAESSPRHTSTDAVSIDSSVSGSEGRCISPSVGASPQQTVQGVCYGNLQQQDLHHDNLWSHSIEIIEASLNDDLEKEQYCQLTSLNLSHNAYKTIPPVLACFAVNLSRLNMSYNRLVDMGSVTCYPAGLKHLDLSHNHIVSWPTQNRVDPEVTGDSSGILCYNYLETSSPQRSKSSPAAKKPSSNLPSWGSMKSLLSTPCAHRRHIKLDNLRTFILADNQLDRLVLTIEEDIGEEDESKIQEADTISTTSRESCSTRSKLLYPALSMLDISNNYIKEVPASISELTNLSVLNISGNTDICYLPPEMGLLTKLWNLNTRCCNLNEPLKSMIDSKKYKTMDVIGYLKSILEDAKPYARMKLMIVGVEGIGKTSLLDQLRQEGTGTYRKKPPEHWAKRMGNKNINQKTSKGISMSTVGVDVGDWVYEKKVRGQSSYGPVIFRTWDFGGQKEYYATHQYFLSKRSLYLVVWRITDGERGVNTILQWLVNIQARAPNAPVLIVGTHYDLVKERCPPSYSEELQQLIREKFINVVDADKYGLPRVLDTIEVSCKTRHNVKLLCNLIYDTVFDLKCPGSKERLLEQRIPATYLALEDVVGNLSVERHLQGKDPVLRAEQYKMLVMHEMQQRYNIAFRDMAELNQATAFLHENGVLLHYEDATLKDLYFLDPQWLCDMLAHVVTIREINPFARNGIMKIEDLKHVFKSSQCAPTDAQNYILYLLNKFEVALTWDNRTLLIPSLLPTEEQLRAGFPGCEVRIPLRSRSWALRKNFTSTVLTTSNTSFNLVLKSKEKRPQKLPLEGIYLTNNISKPEIQDQDASCLMSPTCFISHLTQHEDIIRRLLIMSYFPSGFWSRLMTRMLADDLIVEVIRSYFILPKDLQMDPLLASILNQRAEWVCWQTGMELRYLDSTLFRMKEILPYLNNSPCDYRQMRFLLQQEGVWNDVDINNSSILEILLPNQVAVIQKPVIGDITENQTTKQQVIELKPSKECVAKLLSLAVDHVDTLLEDWYPTLGTRFVHTSEGKFLVTRLVPCTYCLATHLKEELMGGGYNGENFSVFDHHWDKESWQMVDVSARSGGEPSITKSCLVSGNNLWTSGLQNNQVDCSSPNIFRRNQGSRSSTVSHDSDSGVGPDSNSSSRKPSAEGRTDDAINSDQDPSGQICATGIACDVVVYNFMVEDCILVATQQECLQCPSHGNLSLTQISPDIVFVDLGERFLIQPDSIRRGKMLGRGAFGFVFKASVKQRGSNSCANVAMKMLQPVDPGFGARQSDTVAYKAAWNKWQRDPLQYACKAYCTARQELNILMSLRHTNIVPLVGVCTHPLALVLQLAPQGALDSVLRNYRRSGARLDLHVLQKVIIQIAKALEYLHQQHIIYRDLKSENVLVWDFPPPFHALYPLPVVEIKLADYGISRSTLPTGTKGFGGTEGFMAPEIMRYNGEEEYTEKVDCFSFGMFMYELITLHLPFEGHECAKDHILDGGRPSLTYREMLYPTYVLDLMTLCWSQQPKDRPSASQIVSIATAPEFTHLVDIVSLNDRMAVLSAGAIEVTSSENGDGVTKEAKWEVWLSRLGKQLDILSSTEHGWRDYKALTLETVTVTALCLVNDTIWLGDSRGKIHIYSIASHIKLSGFSLETMGITSSAIRSMCYLKDQKYVAMATSDGRLWLCNIQNRCQFEEQVEENTELDNVADFIQELGSKDCPVFCIAAVSLSDNKCELWCGQTQGSIKIFALHDAVVTSHEVVYHYDPVIDNLDVTQLVSNSQKQPMIWSYVYPGCVAYHWDTVNRTILHKLDCSKLAPCSESLMSISIEEHLSPGRCQVTAMAVLGTELYIGTTWGCIIVAESVTMRPITIFRPFEEEVKAILPLGIKFSSKTESPITPDISLSFIAAVGKGYRNLIGRYTALPNFNIHIHDNMYLLLIRTDNWSSG